MGARVGGAKSRGGLEERLKAVLNEVTNSNLPVMLFIDEIHAGIREGRTERAMDSGNSFRPILVRVELRSIGVNTFDVYPRYM